MALQQLPSTFHPFNSSPFQPFSVHGGWPLGSQEENAKNAKGLTQRTQRRGAGGEWEGCGRREATRISRMPLRGLEGWVGDGCYIDKREKRFADLKRCRDAGGAPAEMIRNRCSFKVSIFSFIWNLSLELPVLREVRTSFECILQLP